jgi:hypothetical membrane protein
MKTKSGLALGFVIPVVFWATTFVCGFILGNYDHSSRMVSELGAAGTRSQAIFFAGFLLCSILGVIFMVGISRACKAMGISMIPALFIIFFSLPIAGVAIFPLPLKMHVVMGTPSLLLVFSPLLGLILWQREKRLPHLKLMAGMAFLLMALGFLVFLPDALRHAPGLKQRFFHLGWSIWFFYLSYGFLRTRRQGS